MKRRYGDYSVTIWCYDGEHDKCHSDICQCPHHEGYPPPRRSFKQRLMRALEGRW